MSTIREVAGQELTWLQPARAQQAFEMHAGDEAVASLRADRPAAPG